jgi:hypothetical protein
VLGTNRDVERGIKGERAEGPILPVVERVLNVDSGSLSFEGSGSDFGVVGVKHFEKDALLVAGIDDLDVYVGR